MKTTNAIWPMTLADKLEERRPSGVITIASGISPSGPVHMGNLREVMTGAFVAEELRRRGRSVRHILSWDDYDRFRKVPVGIEGVNDFWNAYIGDPLTSVPAPTGSTYLSWADHFRAAFRAALEELHVEVEEISQTQAYEAGTYDASIEMLLRNRRHVGSILAKYQTKGETLDVDSYYPYKPYCKTCGKDTTTLRDWNGVVFSYSCDCSAEHFEEVATIKGKLVWKVDWPMRWRHEAVDFEPAGRDHMSPGSSWTVGQELMQEIFGEEGPLGQPYSFVGIDGQAKMASSKGGAPTPGDLLPLMGPEVMRWLYVRSRPEQAFSIDIANISRLMDEWDGLQRKVKGGTANEWELAQWQYATGNVREDDLILNSVKYSAWVSYADMTMGNLEEMKRLAEADSGALLPPDQPRALQAIAWVRGYMPDEARTHFSTEFREEYFDALPEDVREAVVMLREGLYDHWHELTRWVFGVPKVVKGFGLDERALPPEVKAFQREYFVHVYQLLVGEDKGPRLPSLFQCLGSDRVRTLLGG